MAPEGEGRGESVPRQGKVAVGAFRHLVTKADVDAVVEELQRLDATAPGRAVARRHLQLHWSDRRLRSVVSKAPGMGVPLLSCNEGYFVATSPHDYDICVADLLSRIDELRIRARAIARLKTRFILERDGQLSLLEV